MCCVTVTYKMTGMKVRSTFRQTGPSYGPLCDEVFFYHDSSVADEQQISDAM